MITVGPARQSRRGGEEDAIGLRVLVVGGDDHRLRIPFLQKLARRGFVVGAAGSDDAASFERAAIPYFRLELDRFVNPIADRRTLGLLARIISKFRPHIVQAFDTKPCILAPIATLRSGADCVRTVNGLGWVYSTNTPAAAVLRPILDALYRLTAANSRLTVFQNRSDMAYFERARLVRNGRGLLIPGSGVDVDAFDKALGGDPQPESLRRELGLENARVVLTVTRLSRIKGLATLLEAASIVNRLRPDVRFILVGSRESESRLAVSQEDIDRHAPYVRAIGSRNDVPALLGLADVFAFPTELREGVPRALLEAALAAVPIVTTNMPGCMDIVEDGVSGLVVPPRDQTRLAQAIFSLLDDPERAAAMGRRAGALVRKEFSLELTVDRYARAYMGLRAEPAAFGQPVTA